jgi:pimeloyl-ACP methyl ester carboxylesterase
MTNRIETFERPELFERDTWNKQVIDLRSVVEAMARGEIGGEGLAYVMFGHSRGGVTALLTAGRFADDQDFPQPVGVITAAAPSTCNPLSRDEADRLMEQRYLESPSSRTGQRLRVGEAFLQEQLHDPGAHDLLRFVGRIRCPLLVIHGDRDPTVDVLNAKTIAMAAGRSAGVSVIRGADHVFNTPNPMQVSAPASPQLRELIVAAVSFCERVISV